MRSTTDGPAAEITAAATTTPSATRSLRTAAEQGRSDAARRFREAFAPRPVPQTWPATRLSRQEAWSLMGVSPLVAGRGTHGPRALGKVLDWLSAQPGHTWQQRWQASGAQQHTASAWVNLPTAWLVARAGRERGRHNHPTDANAGLLTVIAGDLIRPDLAWLLTRRSGHLARVLEAHRDPAGFAALRQVAATDAGVHPQTLSIAFTRIATIMAAKGGLVADITVGDCVELVDTMRHIHAGGGVEKRLFYRMLHHAGIFTADAPATLRLFATNGQLSVEELVERAGIANPEVRDLLVDYLRERQPSMDYSTLTTLVDRITRLFWRDLERHHPGIDSLHLPTEVAAAWKQRAVVKTVTLTGPDGRTVTTQQPRASGAGTLIAVRGLYLDLAHWAAEDPARWARWVAPCPVRAHDIPAFTSQRRHKAAMDARTRARLPALPRLVAHVDQHRQATAAILRAATQTPPGDTFTAAGQILQRAVVPHTRSATAVWVTDPDTGRRRDVEAEAAEAFWAWAVVEVLRHTGIRIEELLELTHHSLVQYRLPTTGELIPLLQIAPSKTDTERLLVISPELADVLSAIVLRVRGADGTIPAVPFYDVQERLWNPPQPLLFQRRHGDELKALTRPGVRTLIQNALLACGITDGNQQPLMITPHDFRRMFITDAILNGLPPHIAQIICGHTDINTTMGYKAVYPTESITAHRAFLARRRSLRPAEEYHHPSDTEWEQFLGHFEKRKLSLGTCARAYNTPCDHEHACLRCPMLWPDPTQRPRLIEIRDNLGARITEAEHQGWHGEVEGLRVSLAAAHDKLTQMDRHTRVGVPVHLGMPTITDIAGRATGHSSPTSRALP